MSWARWLTDQAHQRDAAGLRRSLHSRGPQDGPLDLAGNDYLGLARHRDVTAAAAAAAQAWGAGAGASPLVTGHTQLHAELEGELADFLGHPAALVTSTGYHANLAAVTALADRDTLIVSDAHLHASLIDGVRLSRAEVVISPHGDADAAAEALARRRPGQRAMVLVESIYSVLGDAAPLTALLRAAASEEVLLLVDEAHGIGVAGHGGHGLVRELGLAGHPRVIVTATLSKSLGAQGGAILGSTAIIDHLINRGRPYIYDTALAPASAAGALAALRHLRAHPSLPGVITKRMAELARRLDVEAPRGAVLSLPLPSPQAALAAQAAAGAAGVRVGCFRPPSTPDGISRLRITVNAGVPHEDWERAVDTLASVVAEHR